jgi:hypothetical protein
MKAAMPDKPSTPPRVKSWREYPHLVKSVEAFSKQPSQTREEQLAQLRRNTAARVKK